MKNDNSNVTNGSRRAFLKRAGSLSLASVAAPWLINLSALADASAATTGEYKALVCIFLSGGNDQANTLVPYDSGNHTLYQRYRPSFAYSRQQLAAGALASENTALDSAGFAHDYALPPALAPLLALFNEKRLGVMLNMGTLVEPTTKQQYTGKSVRLPSKLFSHNDQQSIWQSSFPEGAASGWGGRMGDLFQSNNQNKVFSNISLAGNAVFLSGNSAMQYHVSIDGPVKMEALRDPLFGSAACSAALRTLISEPRDNIFESEYNRINKRALESEELLSSSLASAARLNTIFPANNPLAKQLQMVARMISIAPALGVKRQIFYVTLNGFDNHYSLLAPHTHLLGQLGMAMSAFYSATAELNVANDVTSFTASEFGRTLSANTNGGTDHGWGGMQFVMGGAVKGKRFYGNAPILANDGPDDVGQGRLLPTMSIEQFAATLGGWFGVSDSDLLEVLPNLRNFSASARKLDFV
ncbi:DUF1501 domain-containing protein [Massilia glaciei]|uniref:DUF1501 domain-containing protein n=1 Tax=Massilia glaciei TaxID=1524097 RepID=A0A2U2HGP2_9BURK|nr:DUF1501 domain-containing protein [Massilia glaciei]PWF44361.1 DUF1501 domain-containing protein [Massilia glaciei]